MWKAWKLAVIELIKEIKVCWLEDRVEAPAVRVGRSDRRSKRKLSHVFIRIGVHNTWWTALVEEGRRPVRLQQVTRHGHFCRPLFSFLPLPALNQSISWLSLALWSTSIYHSSISHAYASFLFPSPSLPQTPSLSLFHSLSLGVYHAIYLFVHLSHFPHLSPSISLYLPYTQTSSR